MSSFFRGRSLVGLSWRPVRILGLILLLAAGAALSGCASELPQTPFDPKGPVAQMQLSLLKLSMWFAVAIGAVVAGLLLYAVIRFKAKGDEKQIPKQIRGNHTLEIIWTLIPILILVLVGVPTVKTIWATQAPLANAQDAVTVRVVGHQWWFEFQYPNEKVVTGNEMFIPVGQPINIELTSEDVIHSFWVPKLGGKMDVIPGRTNRMWLQADEAGNFYGQCAELCGTSHAKMRFRVRAVSKAEFDQWVKDRQSGAVKPVPNSKEAAGLAIMQGQGNKAACFSCHSIDGAEKMQGKVGPNLSNVGARTTIAAGLLDNTEENLKAWIRDPQSIKPEAKMPSHPNLSDEDLNSIVAYLRSLKK
jgi:cytochrome c oxidase subunit II